MLSEEFIEKIKKGKLTHGDIIAIVEQNSHLVELVLMGKLLGMSLVNGKIIFDDDYFFYRDIEKERLKDAHDFMWEYFFSKKNNTADASSNTNATLNKILNSSEAERLFQRIPNIEKCGDFYKWIGTKALFGYFVDKTSEYLNLRPSNNRIPWSIYKEAFNLSDKDISTAKQFINDYRNKNCNEPEGFEAIKLVCK